MLGRFFAVSVAVSAISACIFGNTNEVANAVFAGSAEAVTLAVSMTGIVCLWSGALRVLDKCGVTSVIGRVLSPVVELIFPSARQSEEAREAVSCAAAVSFLGVGNASIPSGVRAMKSLSSLGRSGERDAVALAVLSSAPVQLFPSTLMAIRSAYTANAYDVLPAIWCCSVTTTVFGILLCRICARVSE